MASDNKVLLYYKSRFYLVFLNWTLVIFVVLELWRYLLGDRFISWKYIKEVGGEVPKDIYDSSWNKIVNTGYQRAQSSYIIQTELGNKNIDLLSCKAADLTEEDLLAKNKNYIPPGNYNISEWVKVVNSGFHLGQHFFLNDMRNQQEANDAQIALSLSSGEQEGTV